MKALIAALVFLAVVALAAKLLRKRSRVISIHWPVTACRVLSAPEQVLYRRLLSACPGLVVLSQVALSQLIDVQRVKGRQAVFNRISRLVADFVLCTPDFVTVAVIELDDRSHENEKRADADRRKTTALAAAGIPLHRFNMKALPSVEQIQSQVLAPIQAAEPPGRNGATRIAPMIAEW